MQNGLSSIIEVNRSGAQFPDTQNMFLNGSLSVQNGLNVVGAVTSTTAISTATNVSGLGSVFGGVISTPKNVLLSVGSPYGQGIVVQLTARTIISGGMWVTCSGGLAMAASTLAQTPMGVAQPGLTAQSGGTVNVIIKGIVPMICEGTILVENGCTVGAGAGLNTVRPMVAGSGTGYATLDSAASGTTTTVFVVL